MLRSMTTRDSNGPVSATCRIASFCTVNSLQLLGHPIHDAGCFRVMRREVQAAERVNYLLHRSPALQSYGRHPGEGAKNAAEERPLLAGFDPHFTEPTVRVLTAAQVECVPAHLSLLGPAGAPVRQL